jgi:hypothetical protein
VLINLKKHHIVFVHCCSGPRPEERHVWLNDAQGERTLCRTAAHDLVLAHETKEPEISQFPFEVSFFFSKRIILREVHLDRQVLPSPFARTMLLISSTATALLGAVFALASIDNAYACALHHTADEHQSDDPSAGSVQVLRSLMENNESAPEAKFICGTPDLTKTDVKAFADMVDQFYQGPPGSPGERRDLQQPEPIVVYVNFVNVRNSAGTGATNAQVNDQMSWLQVAFHPFFQFKLLKLQEVINDSFFGTISRDEAGKVVETQMKTAHKIGGMEILNIYSVDTSRGGVSGTGGWAYYPTANAGVMDGVVILYSSLPGGGHNYWTQGDVSFEAVHAASCTQWIAQF